MKWITDQEIPLFRFELLASFPDIDHGVTTRKGGFSHDTYAGLNLSMQSGDSSRNVLLNREKLARSIGLKPEKLLFPEQCHTSIVKLAGSNTCPEELSNCDALITNEPGIALAVLAADCVPLILYDPVTRSAAAIHAGWKGTVGRIVARTVEQMVKQLGVHPSDLRAGIGPCISAAHYEIGEDVAVKLQFWFSDTEGIILPGNTPGKWHADLALANRQLLLRYGLQADRIEMSNICTYENPELFYSARRDGFHSGRFGTFIMLY